MDLGAKIDVKDLFVEQDWMIRTPAEQQKDLNNSPRGSGPLQRLPSFDSHQARLGPVVATPGVDKFGTAHDQTFTDIQAFDENPIEPIKIHFDTGAYGDAGLWSKWTKSGRDLGGGNGVTVTPQNTEACKLTTGTGNNPFFDDVIEKNFDRGRRWVFTYGLTSFYADGAGCGGGQGGDDWPQYRARGTFVTNWGTASSIMHELGHTLGLQHGVFLKDGRFVTEDADSGPQYTSVMNALYLTGIPLDQIGRTGFLDYSPARPRESGVRSGPLRQMTPLAASDVALSTTDRGYFVSYPAMVYGDNLVLKQGILRSRTNVRLRFTPAPFTAPRLFRFHEPYRNRAPVDLGLPAQEFPDRMSLMYGEYTDIAVDSDWARVMRNIGVLGNLPGEFPVVDDSFGDSELLAMAPEQQSAYVRALQVSAMEADLELVSATARSEGPVLVVDGIAGSTVPLDDSYVEVQGPGLAPTDGCEFVPGQLICPAPISEADQSFQFRLTLSAPLEQATEYVIKATRSQSLFDKFTVDEIDWDWSNNSKSVLIPGPVTATTTTTTLPPPVEGCGVCVTASSGTGVSLGGSAKITVTGGGLAANSNGTPAIALSGSSKIIVSGKIRSAGTATKTGGASFTGTVENGVAAPVFADPYAGRGGVSSFGPNNSTTDYSVNSSAVVAARPDGAYRDVRLTGTGTYTLPDNHRYRDVTIGGSTSVTLKPGLYRSVSIGGAARVTFTPGVYVITKSFNMNSSGVFNATGVRFVLACATPDGDAHGCNNEPGASFTLGGSVKLTLNANSPQLPAISSVPGNTSAILMDGSARLELPSSGIDAPTGPLRLNGSATITAGASVQAATTTLTGSATITITNTSQTPQG